MRRLHLALASLVVAGLLVACTSDSGSSTAASAAQDDVCAAYTDIRDSYEAFQALDPASASIEEYQAAAEEVLDALDDYLTLRGSEAAQTEYQLRVTLSQLAVSLRAASGQMTIEEAIEESQPEIEAAQAAIDSIGADSGCVEGG
jgi:hypothetical protein